MKNYIKKVFYIGIIFICLSCSKSDDGGSSFAIENPMKGYLEKSGQNAVAHGVIDSYQTSEMGIFFTPTVTGKITAITVMLPATVSSLRVTIWDTDKTVIKTEKLKVTSADVMMTFDIDDINLIKDKRYAISMNSNNFYSRSRSDIVNYGSVKYPIVVGNITINSFTENGGSTQAFPFNVYPLYYHGDLSFNFQQTE